MEKVTNQKVIALKFDTIAEPEYLLSIIEEHLTLVADQGRPLEADEIMKALKDCIEMFKHGPSIMDPADDPERRNMKKVDPVAYQKAPVDPKKDYMEKIHGKIEN